MSDLDSAVAGLLEWLEMHGVDTSAILVDVREDQCAHRPPFRRDWIDGVQTVAEACTPSETSSYVSYAHKRRPAEALKGPRAHHRGTAQGASPFSRPAASLPSFAATKPLLCSNHDASPVSLARWTGDGFTLVALPRDIAHFFPHRTARAL